MNTQQIIDLEDAFQIPTYNKLPIALERGEGCYVWDTDGKMYLDFYGGHCVTQIGHCPPRVVNAIQEQTKRILFYSNVVYSPLRAKCADLLAKLAPETLKHVYFCNSGAEANETALKLARTFTGKNTVLAMHAGFHGRTIGSLSATGIEKYRTPYLDILPPASFVHFGSIEEAATALEENDDIAAIILEPIQSMAGIMEQEPSYYQALRDLATKSGVALIFDEVQTGVGRTGTFSISEQFGIKPDLITMAKSLGSGLPVGAVFVSDNIAASVKPGDHGSTFGGGMVSMAAVIGTLETIIEENLMEHAVTINNRLKEALLPHVVDVRGKGCLVGVECAVPVKPLIGALREAGVLVGSSFHPNVIRLMPPVNTPMDVLESFIETFVQTVTELEVA